MLGLEQVPWLLRCFDGDDLNPKRYEDLIDVYAFQRDIRNLAQIERIKADYLIRTQDIPKVSKDEAASYPATGQLWDTLQERLDQWADSNAFLDWLCELAPVLDQDGAIPPANIALPVYYAPGGTTREEL